MIPSHLVGSRALLAVFLVHALWAGLAHPPAPAAPAARAAARATGVTGATSVRRGAPAGYPYARAVCEYGARGGPYCANPGDQNDLYNWGYPKRREFDAGDPWGYEYRNCTSYVAWRLARAHVPVSLFSYLGNAAQWIGGVTGERGVVVNHTPAPGAVAAWDGPGVGHVAWVVSVRGGRVTVADFNYDGTGVYAQHVIGSQPDGYIHFPSS